MSAKRKSYDWKVIRAFYDLGHSAAECQARFGISNGAWYAAAQRGAIVLRDMRTRPRTKTRNAVAELLDAGMTLGAIARELGVSTPTVCAARERFGVGRDAWAAAVRDGVIQPRANLGPSTRSSRRDGIGAGRT